MSNLIIQQLENKLAKHDLPEIKPGYTVRVHQKIKEGEKERVQVYEGLVIAISHGHGHSKTITVRKIVEGIGVEKIFSLSSPNVVKIEVVRIGKVRRAKLYYMRNISGKAARLKEMLVSGKAATQTVAEQDAVATEESTDSSEDVANVGEEATPAEENIAADEPDVSTEAAGQETGETKEADGEDK
jgi:large subunit ribosomal protein L19